MFFIYILTVISVVLHGVTGRPDMHTKDHRSVDLPVVNGENITHPKSQEDSRVEGRVEGETTVAVVHTHDDGGFEVFASVKNNDYETEAEIRSKRVGPHKKSRKHKKLHKKKSTATDTHTKSQEVAHAASNSKNLKPDVPSQKPQMDIKGSPAKTDSRDVAEGLH